MILSSIPPSAFAASSAAKEAPESKAAAAAAEAAPASSPPRAAAVSTAITPNGSWVRYHADDAHTGYDPAQPAVVGAAAGWTSPTLDGDVYTEPLVYNGLI